jgi:hypothetical protein
VPDVAQPASGALARSRMQRHAGIIILGPFCAAAGRLPLPSACCAP